MPDPANTPAAVRFRITSRVQSAVSFAVVPTTTIRRATLTELDTLVPLFDAYRAFSPRPAGEAELIELFRESLTIW